MKIKYLVGDATAPIGEGTKIIAHICNDMGGWGRGFVLALSERWPLKKKAGSPEWCYREWKKKKWDGRDFVLGQIQTIWVEDKTFVCNMIAQRDYKPLEEKGVILNIPNCNLTSLHECFRRLAHQVRNTKTSIHMPRIGTGLGGESWDRIERVINSVFADSDIEVYVYDQERKSPLYNVKYEN